MRRVGLAEMRQCRGERQMRKCEIAVGLDGAAKPGGRLFVFGEMQFRGPALLIQ
jgi:hypothetical protein